MKKFLFIIIISISLLFISCTNFDIDKKNITNDEINIEKYNLIEKKLERLTKYDYFENQLNVGYYNIESLNKLAKYLKADINVNIEKIKVANLKFNYPVEEALRKLLNKSFEGIKFIEPNYKRKLIEPVKKSGFNETLVKSVSSPKDPKNPLYEFQWALNKFDAKKIWETATGTGVVIAVMDGGSDSRHPDLNGQYVDGIDFYNYVLIPANTSVPYGDHGTHVSGIIAAKKDDNYGIAGLAPEAKIMVAPVFAPNFIGDIYVAYNAMWAVDNGAKILQNSWGGPGFSDTLKAGFDYALANNVLVVVSTGNTHIEESWGSPNSLPGILGVGASDVNDNVAEFSTRGDSVSVLAPGVQILSTIPIDSQDVSEIYGPFAYWNGTSMASPYVSALAALLWEKYPNATAYQIRKLIELSAKDIDKPGYDTNSGYGVIDPQKALSLPLPEEKGAMAVVSVKDSYGNPLAGVYVTLYRETGPNYYARTNSLGQCAFYQIDPDTYDIIIGGPDLLDSIVLRPQEQLSKTLENVEIKDITEYEQVISVTFNSTLELSLTPPTATGNYTLKIIAADTDEVLLNSTFNEATTISKSSIGTPTFYIKVESDNMPVLPAPIFEDDFESGILNWDTGDNAATIIDDNGNKIISFPDIDDDEESYISTTVTLDSATYGYKFVFDYKVSSEEGWDFLFVYVDGEVVFKDSGDVDWTTKEISLSEGTHEIKIAYVKDGAVSKGSDTAWVDNIKISKIPDDYLDYAVTGTAILNGETINITHSLYDGTIVDDDPVNELPWNAF
jgi:subtilisin family serine protease